MIMKFIPSCATAREDTNHSDDQLKSSLVISGTPGTRRKPSSGLEYFQNLKVITVNCMALNKDDPWDYLMKTSKL
jgi:hypothetical protein